MFIPPRLSSPGCGGYLRTPSVVAFTDKSCLISNAAVNQLAMNPRNTIFDVLVYLGRLITGFDFCRQNVDKPWLFDS
jgi:molecular chaperone DnaK (HSP70)